MTTRDRVESWYFEPAPPDRLATFRLLVGAFALLYLLIRFPAFAALADATPTRFDGVGVLWWLESPIGGAWWTMLLAVTVVFAWLYAGGVWFRFSGPLFALLLLVITTYRSSWGQLLYFENLLVIHVIIVGFASSADAFAITRRRTTNPARPKPHERYGWPLRLAAIATALTYVLAGIAKLRLGGLSWVVGDSLRNHIAYSATRLGVLGGTPSPLARPLTQHEWLFPPLAALTLAIELGAPVALFNNRLRNVWVALTWLMHLSIAVTMFVVFPYPLSGIAFAPLFHLERLRRRLAVQSLWSRDSPDQNSMRRRGTS